MVKLSVEALERSSEESARLLCLLLLEEAERALERMERGEDGEALHDFRVALRRSRSAVGAYRRFLAGSRPRKLASLLKSLASSTNVARDVEVQLDYLGAEQERLQEPASSASAHLRERIEARLGETPTAAELRRRFDTARKVMKRNLARMHLKTHDVRDRFQSATGRLIREHGERLLKRLEAVESARDAAALHRARIAAKRLRYLLEPLQRELSEARPLIKKMRSLQDCLGELQDTRVLTEEIGAALESSALEEARALRELALNDEAPGDVTASARPGLLALLEVQRERRDAGFRELTSSWIGDAGRGFFAEVETFGEGLIGEAETLPKRRFLLRGLPEAVRGLRPDRLRMGWLPGRKLLERVESLRAGRRVSYRRAVRGTGDVVLEEPLTRPSFDALWSLTDGRRLDLQRYGYRDGDRRWVLLACERHGIVLAEAELPADAPLPRWIAAYVRRDVTGSERYELFSLARRRQAKRPDPPQS